MKKILLIITGLLFSSCFIFAQKKDSFEDALNKIANKPLISFVNRDEVLERPVMSFFEQMRDNAFSYADELTLEAQILAAIFMIIYLSVKGWEMLSGDKQLEILPLLRPFGLAIIIFWWGTFTKLIALPTQMIAEKTEKRFEKSKVTIDDLYYKRELKLLTIRDNLLGILSDAETAEEQAKQTKKDWIDKGISIVKSATGINLISSILKGLKILRTKIEIASKTIITQILEVIALWLLRACVYIVFLIQIIYGTILVIIGPLSVAISILPSFKDSLTTWIARFISVNLYTGLAFLVLWITSILQIFALTSEINRFDYLLKNKDTVGERIAWLTGSQLLSVGTVIVCFVVSAITVLTVPSISTWIVSTSGVTSAVSTAGRGASSVSKKISTLFLK